MKPKPHDPSTQGEGVFEQGPPPGPTVDLQAPAAAQRPPSFRERLALFVLFSSFTLAVLTIPLTLRAWGIDVLDWFGAPAGAAGEQAVLPPSSPDAKLASLSTDELVQLRIHGVNPEFIQAMRQLGYRDLSVDELVELSIHGVRPEFIRAMGAAGYAELPVSDLVELSIHGVEAGFVREMQQLGYRDWSIDDLVRMRIHGVDPGFVRALQEAGFSKLSADELVQLRIHGVDAAFASRISGARP